MRRYDLISLMFLLFFLFPVVCSSDVIVDDMLVLKGEEVMLSAQTRGRFFTEGGRLVEFFVNGKTMTVKAGESIDVPPNTLHTFSNKSDSTCKWINIHSPKGFREFFEKLGVPANEPDAASRSVAPEIIQQVIQTAADYDMHVQG